jgi:hypothetical protein
MSTSICRRLIRPNAEQLFAEHCEEIHRTWAELLRKTSLPDNATSTDSRVLSAIRALDNTIKRPESQGVARLAYVQLTRVLADLRKKIQDDRRQGLIPGRRSQRDATVAINIYLDATGRARREDVYKLISCGNRWAAMAGRYPLLLYTLTEVAEGIVYVKSHVALRHVTDIQSHRSHLPKQRIQALAEENLRVFPTALIVASKYLATDAEFAVRSDSVQNPERAEEMFALVKKMLTC